MARMLKDNGPPCLQSLSIFQQLLHGKLIDAREVSTAVIFMARTSSDPQPAVQSLWGSAATASSSSSSSTTAGTQ